MHLKKKLGQHFLVDQNIINKLVRNISPNTKDTIVEIGPGDGAMTKLILPHVKKMYLIEKDTDLLNELVLTLHKYKNSKIINQDILKYDFSIFDNPFRVIGNLPYNISTQIILRFIHWSKYIQDMHFLVQKEVAEKITGTIKTKNWGKLSIKIAAFFNTEILFDVPPESFDIKPKVMSSFIRMTPKQNLEFDSKLVTNLYKVIDLSFSSRRKNIKNNLKKQNFDWDNLDIDFNLRPEELSLSNYVELAKAFKE